LAPFAERIAPPPGTKIRHAAVFQIFQDELQVVEQGVFLVCGEQPNRKVRAHLFHTFAENIHRRISDVFAGRRDCAAVKFCRAVYFRVAQLVGVVVAMYSTRAPLEFFLVDDHARTKTPETDVPCRRSYVEVIISRCARHAHAARLQRILCRRRLRLAPSPLVALARRK